jgi:recombination protein RecA
MPTASHLRAQIEATLAERIPSALTPLARVSYPVAATGIHELDVLLRGGFPVGAISEVVGPECSGRTSLALTFVAGMTQAGKVCAWVDVSDTLHPESAAAMGVDLSRLLWIRCGRSPGTAPLPPASVSAFRMAEKPQKTKPVLQQGGGGHPRMEAKGLSAAVSDLLGPAVTAPRCAEVQPKPRPQGKQLDHAPQNGAPAKLPVAGIEQKQSRCDVEPYTRQAFSSKSLHSYLPEPHSNSAFALKTVPRSKSWSRLEQALRVTDLLLQAGGFSCIVLDMGSLNAEYALRVPLSTWFRFRAAAERWQSNVLLLTQHPCSRNSAGLVLRLEPGSALTPDSTVFTGLEHRAELARRRFPQSPGNVLPLRKQPQSVLTAQWQGNTLWAGRR